MKQIVKQKLTPIILLAITLALGLQCSKKDDPAAAAATGCTFTFKGTSYTFDTATCLETDPGEFGLGSNSSSATEILTLVGGTSEGITFTGGGDVYSDSGGTATVSISGSTWTFNGTILNGDGDSQAISGKCTCSN